MRLDVSKFHKRYSKEELIKIIQNLYKDNDINPSQKHFKYPLPTPNTLTRAFGSWENALMAAGVKKRKIKDNDYSKDELIKLLQKYYNDYQKVPTIRKMKSLEGYPSVAPFTRIFGSFKNALIEANLFQLRADKHQFDKIEYTKEELFNFLIRFLDENGHIPTKDEVDICEYMPTSNAYYNKFGGIHNALKEFNFDLVRYNEKKKEKYRKEIKQQYIYLCEKLGRTLSSRDIDEYSKTGLCAGTKTYATYFGSIYNLQIECGLVPTVIGRNKTREQMIKDLCNLAQILDRTPLQKDVDECNWMASSHKYYEEFGGFSEALILAKIDINTGVYFTNRGTKCLSYYELKITSWLEDNNIIYKKEVSYRNVIKDDKSLRRFDWVIHHNENYYYVEMFGITNNEEYEKKTIRKIEDCSANGITLIALFPEELKRPLDEVFSFLYDQNLEVI